MELPTKKIEQLAVNTRSSVEEHILIVMDKNAYEEHLCQPLQTKNKQFKIVITFLIGYNGICNVTNSYNKFYLLNSVTDEDGYIQNCTPPGAYEIDILNIEIKGNIIDEEHYTELGYPFTLKPNFSTLGPIIEKSTQRTVITFPMIVKEIF